jgi:hypothetical protein
MVRPALLFGNGCHPSTWRSQRGRVCAHVGDDPHCVVVGRHHRGVSRNGSVRPLSRPARRRWPCLRRWLAGPPPPSCALCGRRLGPEAGDAVIYNGRLCHIDCVQRELAELARCR